jgi:hypothetical protein
MTFIFFFLKVGQTWKKKEQKFSIVGDVRRRHSTKTTALDREKHAPPFS